VLFRSVCTEILGLEGEARVGRYGNCAQWQAAQAEREKLKPGRGAQLRAKKAKPRAPRTGLTASEKKELQDMESAIQEADEHVEHCTRAMEDPEAAADHVEAQKRWDALEAAKNRVKSLYIRWEELEAKLAK